MICEPKPVCKSGFIREKGKAGFIREKGKATAKVLLQSPDACSLLLR
jgi:hypothetical protein